MPNDAFVILIMLGLSVMLVLGFIVLRRRTDASPAEPDPTHWKQETAEPWGSILLVVFFLSPVLIKLGEWVGWGPFALVTVIGLLGFLVYLTRPLTALRELTVGDDAVEIRLLFRQHSIPLTEVLSVTSNDNGEHEVHLSDGSTVSVGPGAHGEAIARTIATRIGQSWSFPTAGQATCRPGPSPM